MQFDDDNDFLPAFRASSPRRGPGTGDLTATILWLVLLAISGAVLSFIVVLELMGVSGCSEYPEACDLRLLAGTIWVTPITAAIAIILTIIALVARASAPRRTWWVPFLGNVVTFVAFVVASLTVSSALQEVSGW